jgi:hypothetical protein
MYYFNSENVLASFAKDLVQFKETWLKYSILHSGIKIPSDCLTLFFKDLQGNLGMSTDSEKDIIKYTTKMCIQGDNEGFVFFNEMLFKTMKRIYGTDRTRKKKLRDSEIQTLLKLEKIKETESKVSRKNERLQAVQVNPFLIVMYKNMSFKAWRKVYKENEELRQKQQSLGLERDSSDEDISNRVNDDFYYSMVEEYEVDSNN